jgi:hypothetical protein
VTAQKERNYEAIMAIMEEEEGEVSRKLGQEVK